MAGSAETETRMSSGAGHLALALLLLCAPASAFADESWYPSRYGKDDALGAINELSPGGVLEAAKLIKTGKTYSLAVETGRDTPAYPPRSYGILTLPSGDGSGNTLGSNLATGNDDFLTTWLGIGTQIDGLGHLGIDHRYYNGVHVSEFLLPDGLLKFGTHTLPPIVTRGVLLDLAAHRGVSQLAGGTATIAPRSTGPRSARA